METKAYAASEATKHAMSGALKSLMARKPLEKITIREIMDGCGMKRQNFYYHFTDIYDLVRWMFQEEAVSLLRRHEGVLLWQDGLLQLFQYLRENQAVCLCALHSLGREHLREFFQSDIYAIIQRTINSLAAQLGRSREEINTPLIVKFYTAALCGVMEDWLLGDIDCSPEELIQFVDTLLQDNLRGTALRMRDKLSEEDRICT